MITENSTIPHPVALKDIFHQCQFKGASPVRNYLTVYGYWCYSCMKETGFCYVGTSHHVQNSKDFVPIRGIHGNLSLLTKESAELLIVWFLFLKLSIWLLDLDSDLLVSEFEGFVSKKRLSSSRQHNTREYSRRTYE